MSVISEITFIILWCIILTIVLTKLIWDSKDLKNVRAEYKLVKQFMDEYKELEESYKKLIKERDKDG